MTCVRFCVRLISHLGILNINYRVKGTEENPAEDQYRVEPSCYQVLYAYSSIETKAISTISNLFNIPNFFKSSMTSALLTLSYAEERSKYNARIFYFYFLFYTLLKNDSLHYYIEILFLKPNC